MVKRLILYNKSNSFQYEPLPLEETNQIPEKPTTNHYAGIIYAILSSVCQLINTDILRYLRDYKTTEIVGYRVFFELIFIIPILIGKNLKFTFFNYAHMLLLRATMLTLSIFFQVFTIQSLPVAESNAILYSVPIMTALLSRIVFKNKFSNIMIIALVNNIVGLILVCRLWDGLNQERALGLASGFAYLLCNSLSTIVLKKLTLDLATNVVVFHVSWIRFVYMATVSEIRNNFDIPQIPKCDYRRWYASEPILIIISGLTMLGYAVFYAKAVKLENASTAPAIKASILLPLFVISQMIIFKNMPSLLVVIGVFLVLVTSLLINLDVIAGKMKRSSMLNRFVTKINSY